MSRCRTALCALAASLLVWNFVQVVGAEGSTPSASLASAQAADATAWNTVAWSVPNIARVMLPYQIAGSGPEGLRDVSLYDVALIRLGSARIALGPAFGFAGRESSFPSRFTLGPAAGLVIPLSSVLSAGLFTQSLFSERTQLTQLQPMLAYQLGAGWSVSAGDLQFTIDWAKGRLSSVPLGVQLGVVCPVFEQPIRFFVSPQYNLKDVPGTDRFKVMLGVAVLASRSDTTNR